MEKTEAMIGSKEKEIFATWLELVSNNKPSSEADLKKYYEVLKTILDERGNFKGESLAKFLSDGVASFMKNTTSKWPDFPKEHFEYYLSISPSAQKIFKNATIYQNYLPEETKLTASVVTAKADNPTDLSSVTNNTTFDNYPKSASNNAQKVLDWKDEHKDEVKGMTRVGWTRANQLAKKEPISYETVKRMSNFNRHRKNADVSKENKSTPWKDNGYVAWLGWGGTTGVDWAMKKVDAVERAKKKKKKTKADVDLDSLDESLVETILDQYLITCLWAEYDNSDEQGGDHLDENYDADDFADEALDSAEKDVRKFIASVMEKHPEVFEEFSLGDIGHDLWLTRVGHGAGFWDGDYDNEELKLGDYLTEESKKLGHVDVYVGDDNKLYFM